MEETEKKWYAAGAVIIVAVVVVAYFYSTGAIVIPPIDNPLEGIFEEGAMMTQIPINITLSGRQWSDNKIPGTNQDSDTTTYKYGFFDVSANMGPGGIDQNGQPTSEPQLWNITNSALINYSVQKTIAQLANGSDNPNADRKGYGEGSDTIADPYFDTTEGIDPGDQLAWDSSEESRGFSSGSRGILPEFEWRPFGYVEDAYWQFKTEWTPAVPVIQVSFHFKNPMDGELIYWTSIDIPVPVPMPFDPNTGEETYPAETQTAVLNIFTPFKFVGEKYLKISARGSSVHCDIVKGMPIGSGGGQASPGLTFKEAVFWGYAIASPLVLLILGIKAVIEYFQFPDTITLGIEHDIDHDSLEFSQPAFTEEAVWVYGVDRGAGFFTGTYGGATPFWEVGA